MRNVIPWLAIAAFVLDGCKSPPEPTTVLETVSGSERLVRYDRAVAPCVAVAVDAGTIAAYDQCASAVDADFCRRENFRCGAKK
jgi:hypothetical protein